MKNVLVHLRSLGAPTPAAHLGVRLAAQLDGTLTAVHVVPAVQYAVTAPALGDAKEDASQAFAAALHAGPAFQQWAAAMGARQCDWRVASGTPVAALAQAATRHDIAILDQAGDDLGSPRDVAGLILQAEIPCIVVRREHAATRPLQRAAVAWNGSPEAMRAIYAALPLLQDKQVLLLRGDEPDKYHDVDWDPPFDIGDYLRQHASVTVEQRISTGHDGIANALLAAARNFGADLLVMGAYGRAPLSEMVLGGATHDVLALAEIAVLFHH